MKREEGLNFKEFFNALYRFRYSIILITLISTIIAFLYQYYKQDIYKAKAVIEISASESSKKDILNSATSSVSNIKTEMEVLKSKSVNALALKKVDLSHEYYAYLDPIDNSSLTLIERLKNILSKYKKIDMYNNSPFKIELKKGFNTPYIIKPIDKNRFLLEIKSDKYSKIHNYNRDIKGDDFEFKLIKFREPEYKKYSILVKDEETTIDEARKSINVKRTDLTSNTVNLELEDTSAVRAKNYVNELAEAYIEQNIEFRRKEANNKLRFIDEQLKQITKQLKESTKKLEDFQVNEQAINLSADATNLIKQDSSLNSELEQLKLQKEILLTLNSEIKRENGIDDIPVFGLDGKDSTFINLLTKLQQAVSERKALLEIYTTEHPEVKKQTRVIAQLKNSINSYIKNSLIVVNKKIDKIEQILKRNSQTLSKLPKKEQKLGSLKRDYMVNEKLYNYLLKQKAEISLIKESTFSNTRIIDYASSNLRPIKPKRLLIIIIGFIVGLMIGVIQAFVRKEIVSNVISDIDPIELENRHNIKVIASIPYCKSIQKGIFNSSNSKYIDAFRALRSEIRYITKLSSGPKIVTITSHKTGEGKTTVAASLATVLGLSRKSVILIDADLSSSSIEKYIPITKRVGLSNYLNGETGLVNIIQSGAVEGVDVIASGTTSENVSDILDSADFSELINRLKTMYDYIIIDTPALSKCADAKELIYLGTLNLYIIRANFSEITTFRQLNSIKHIKNTKVVFNAVNNT